ncbi:isoflavone reductase family protein [Saccharata proteae CBS 121410]|uniref:Isoflavone reductase family protein n=1 Tax=Saccharata proteae CBS 121410 TaxID=1314787 RepID=A0A9P4I361_9PEZI|nr:isoflavone reductase family protein [Saccharata proteae CBS 121410]
MGSIVEKDSGRSSIGNVLIIGNQSLSSTIVHALSHNPSLRISVLTSPSQTPPTLSHSHSHPQITHKTTDFSPPSLRTAFAHQDLIISTISGGDYALQTRIINAAVSAGVPRFIPHEFGPDSLNLRVQDRLPPAAERARVIRYLRGMQNEPEHPSTVPSPPSASINGCGEHCTHDHSLTAEDSGVEVEISSGFSAPFSWVAIACGCILDAKLTSGDLGFHLKWQSATIHGDGSERFAATSLAYVGQIVASVIEKWDDDRVRNRYLCVSGTVTTANEVIECLMEKTGKEWEVGYVEVGECVKEGRRRIETGWPDAGMFLMEKSVLVDEEVSAVEGFISGEGRAVLGLGEENVVDVVERAVEDFGVNGKGDCGCS